MNVLLTEEASKALRKYTFQIVVEEVEKTKQETAERNKNNDNTKI